MPLITGPQVLDAIMKSEEYSSYPASMRAVADTFVIAIPEILKDQLQEPVTLTSVMNAKVMFLRYCVDHEYVKKAVAATPEGSLGGMSADSVTSLMQNMMSQAIVIAERVVKDLPAVLESQGVDEELMMAHPKGIGLNPETLDLYKTGKLTIGYLLLMQPMVIFKNS